jgi:hypothetical protein
MLRNWCASVGVALLLVATVVAGGAATPEAAFKEFQGAFKAKDGEKVWGLLSKESQAKLDRLVAVMRQQMKALEKLTPEQRKQIEDQLAKKLGMPLADLLKMDGKQLFVYSVKNAGTLGNSNASFQQFLSATLEDVQVDGDKATANLKTAMKSNRVRFVKEGGSWKVTMPDGK